MTMSAPQPSPAPPDTSARVHGRPGAAGPASARRRRVLLQLADRRGEVRVALSGAAGAGGDSWAVLDLLDALNEGGLLRYGGLHRTAARVEIVYHRA